MDLTVVVDRAADGSAATGPEEPGNHMTTIGYAGDRPADDPDRSTDDPGRAVADRDGLSR
ncbi:hypothetical protein [Plantactinospora endophytica]|uniref:Uncharacterized protein n=1 Tax=Plantactinospora endophytica TaxID=673535 RepID=A0ABQ4EBB7_9ACTN|nr:hypothetical protein [Plantactinospora endophytica]GIG92037.1 hypothetical protein Pen02_69730 [Plantactinospora endophytica]